MTGVPVMAGGPATPFEPAVSVRAGRRPEAATRVSRRVRRPARAPPLAHRGAPARRADGPAGRARRRLPRRPRDPRRPTGSATSCVRRGREPADPDQVRAMLPRTRRRAAVSAADEGPDPEAELRARLILYRAFRDAGAPAGGEAAVARVGLFRREPSARARGRPSPAPGRRDAPPLDPDRARPRARPPRQGSSPPHRAAARDRPPDDHAHRAGRDHPRGAPWRARRSCSRTCCAGVRDRVVVAVTFLAMLELMKRREIVVAQEEPWGPIMARRTTRRGARRGRRRPPSRRGRTARRVAGVVRVIEETVEAVETAEAADDRDRPPTARSRPSSSPRPGARSAPVRRRAAAVAAEIARPRRRRPRDRRRPPRRPRGLACGPRDPRCVLSGDRVELATAPEAGALIARYVGADAVRLSPASLETLAIVAYRQPITKAGDRADPRRRLGLHGPRAAASPAHRRARAGRARPGRPILYGTGLRLPRAVRNHEPRGPAAARRRRGRSSRGGGRRDAGGRRRRRRRDRRRRDRRRPTPRGGAPVDVGERD